MNFLEKYIRIKKKPARDAYLVIQSVELKVENGGHKIRQNNPYYSFLYPVAQVVQWVEFKQVLQFAVHLGTQFIPAESTINAVGQVATQAYLFTYPLKHLHYRVL